MYSVKTNSYRPTENVMTTYECNLFLYVAVIVSAKWATERPYLTGGPLKDSYVFSQIHFHWGSDEREGSEHTVRGIW